MTFAALAGAGVAGRRLVPAAAVLLLALALGASRFGYVGDRIHGFLSPESDRRGHGFEVLALARAKANAAAGAAGPGTRRRAPPPVVARERLRVRGRERGAGPAAARGRSSARGPPSPRAPRSRDAIGRAATPRRRGVAAACAAALLAPAALHIAVCRGWTPIVGVTMPFLSYDPALTIASGGEIGVLVALALAARRAGAAPRARRRGRTGRLKPIIDLRFVVVSGKGGVGRTTVAATLARVAAAARKARAAGRRRGDRSARAPVRAATSRSARRSRRWRPGIDGVNITPASSLHEYGAQGAALRAGHARGVREPRRARPAGRDPGPRRLRAAGQGLVAHHRDARRTPALRPGRSSTVRRAATPR